MGELSPRPEADPIAENLRDTTTQVVQLQGALMRTLLGPDTVKDYLMMVTLDEESVRGLTSAEIEFRDEVLRPVGELSIPEPGYLPAANLIAPPSHQDFIANHEFGRIGSVETNPLHEQFVNAVEDMATLVDESFEPILLESVPVPAFKLNGNYAISPGRLKLITYMKSSPQSRVDVFFQINFSIVTIEDDTTSWSELETELFVHKSGIEVGAPILKQIFGSDKLYERMMEEIQGSFLQRAVQQLNVSVVPTLQAAIDGLPEQR